MESNEAQKAESLAALSYGEFGSKEHQRHTEQYFTRSEVISEQTEIIYKLPLSKRWPFEAADTYMPIYAGASGLIVNSFLRRMLMIHTRPLLTAFPMAILPAVCVKLGWYGYITEPVLAGQLHCSICGEMRGAMVNVALGAVYPMVIGIPFMSAFALGSTNVKVPKIKTVFTNWPKFSQFWTRKLSFFKVQFISLALFQAVVGTFVAKKQIDLVQNEIQTKFAKVDVPDDEYIR